MHVLCATQRRDSNLVPSCRHHPLFHTSFITAIAVDDEFRLASNYGLLLETSHTAAIQQPLSTTVYRTKALFGVLEAQADGTEREK